MAHTKQLSFIIPVYNAKSTLVETVQSILKQDTGSLQIILVDDGSKDGSGALCDRMRDAHPEIVYAIHQPNAGSLAARLAGAAVAEGEYILYVDADDYMLDGAIEHIRQDIASNADLYIYDYLMETVGGESVKTIKVMPPKKTTFFSSNQKIEVSKAFMNNWMNTVCATAIRRECMARISDYSFPEHLKNGEDRIQKMMLLISANNIVYVPYSFYYYRWMPNSQGQGLRNGIFSQEIYENMVAIWEIERANYKQLGFSREDIQRYDKRKLERVCSLLEKHCETAEAPKKLMKLIACDTLFGEISQADICKMARFHVRFCATCLHWHMYAVLQLYWKCIRLVRKRKYGKNGRKEPKE